ncbi:hypothetical protein ACFQI7_32665 [Paenibacillus allorhizosphaerae]|uniref:Butirosin biosynthesis protein H N-terminal domain-containing protein n=1 Tax=Paenibacillus allorhizosphaerae TaxID=2849866 RepID=A0ABM8VUL5_9BACL|nr:hypothetical protein [Paenibacillus allorhizosphaerae]CAG7658654.1 hypothetical protein PAECIP111802_07114 [Paenibacillus allorhizosphaerae]
MKSPIILPMEYPIITLYPMTANAVSIISNNLSETYPWLLNNFLQLLSWRSDALEGRLIIRYSDSWTFYKNCPFLGHQKINKKFIKSKWNGSIFDFIIDSISQGYYVYLYVNTLYISAYRPSRDRPHDLFIYGYDYAQKLFYIADNLNYGKYTYATCTFQELIDAINSLSEKDENINHFDNSIILLNYQSNCESSFELNTVVDGIKAYLSSRAFKDVEHPNALYGISVYNNMNIYLSHLEKNQARADIRPFHALWEHKSMMLMRIRYMYDNKMLIDAEKSIKALTSLVDDALLHRNLILKYNFTMKKEILKTIANKIIQNKQKEVLVLRQVLRNIRN